MDRLGRISSAMAGWREQGVVGAGFLLLLLACAAAAMLVLRTRDADTLVTHTLEVRQNIQALTGLLTDSEAAQRGFLLTGDETYLAPLERARAALPAVQQGLTTLTADNPLQRERLQGIAPLFTQRIEIIDRTIALHRTGDARAAVALVKSDAGRTLSVEIRRRLAEADDEESHLFATRTNEAARQRSAVLAVMLASAIVAMGLLTAVTLLGRRYTRAVVGANDELKREIAAREKIEAQLRQAQKMEAIGRLTGGVAHDFNNMLAIVIGSLDLARTRADDPPRVRKLIESALEGARRGAALTQRLLAFSRQQPLEPKPVDINKSVSDFSHLLSHTLGEQVELETVLAAGLWRAHLDAPQLESAILNLAVNARDAMANGGKLTLETANTYLDQSYVETHGELAAGQYVMIAVTDTGSGMTQEVMANAFEPFFTTKPTGAGTGLGLSQVHGFVKQSGGHVKLYSEQNVGTTVKLYFPRLKAENAAIEMPPPVALAHERGVHTILVVEDEAGVRGFILEALGEIGYKAIEADGADQALNALAAHPEIDLMLTDVVMPGTNGRQLADRALAQRPDLPVLYMTGYTRNAIVHNGVLDPGTHLLSKPFTLAELDAELRGMLATRADPPIT